MPGLHTRFKSAKKRLAVPYRAADLPAERSEFSQPDVALVYTHLAYYEDGLSQAEFKAAVEMLLSCGPSEQTFHYNRWLAQGRASGVRGSGECCSRVVPVVSFGTLQVWPDVVTPYCVHFCTLYFTQHA